MRRRITRRDASDDRALAAARYLDVSAAAVYLSLSEKAIYHRVARRTIPFIKRERRVLFDTHALDRWMRRSSIDATQTAVLHSGRPSEPRQIA